MIRAPFASHTYKTRDVFTHPSSSFHAHLCLFDAQRCRGIWLRHWSFSVLVGTSCIPAREGPWPLECLRDPEWPIRCCRLRPPTASWGRRLQQRWPYPHFRRKILQPLQRRFHCEARAGGGESPCCYSFRCFGESIADAKFSFNFGWACSRPEWSKLDYLRSSLDITTLSSALATFYPSLYLAPTREGDRPSERELVYRKRWVFGTLWRLRLGVCSCVTGFWGFLQGSHSDALSLKQ